MGVSVQTSMIFGNLRIFPSNNLVLEDCDITIDTTQDQLAIALDPNNVAATPTNVTIRNMNVWTIVPAAPYVVIGSGVGTGTVGSVYVENVN